ncbi:MAG: hypothetical protein U0790_00140 [Isosphaeraceae bacterium]
MPVHDWDADGIRREAMAEAGKKLERAAIIVERKAKELLSVEGSMTADQVEHHAAHTPGFAKQFARNVAFRRGKAGTTYVTLKGGKLVDRARSPRRKHP